MTDNEIIKALEDYKNSKILQTENGVIYIGDILDLINRQQAEIKKFEKENNEKFNKWKIFDNRTNQRYAEMYEEAKAVVRAEAIKEFAERFLQEAREKTITYVADMTIKERKTGWYEISFDDFDNLVKEMTENITKIEHNSLCETETYKGGE